MSRAVAGGVALVFLSGCAAPGGERSSLAQSLPTMSFLQSKGTKSTIISELKPGPYIGSSLAVGVEKDLAQRRGEGLGFVRAAPLEKYLNDLRLKLTTGSRVSDVPGRVVVLANPSFAALSTPDGNIALSMGWLEYLENEDEVAAILAHELAHVLLTHHSADLVAGMQRKGQSLHEIGMNAKSTLSQSKTVDKSDTRLQANAQLLVDITDKVALPAWNRGQEREADLLGADLMARAGFAPPAMITMLEKLNAWEKKNKDADAAFEQQLQAAAQKNVAQAVSVVFQRLTQAVSASHPRTEERIDELAAYLDRHYADANLPEPNPAPWKAVASRSDVSQVMRNYDLSFTAKKMHEKGQNREAYSAAKAAVAGSTADDAYPNWMLAKIAGALGHQREAIDALRRAVESEEPIPQIYEEMIFTYEKSANISAALEWTDKASAAFGGAPRWVPTKIRLLRKSGRAADASALTLKCSVDTPEWRRLCQEANQTPEPTGKAQR